MAQVNRDCDGGPGLMSRCGERRRLDKPRKRGRPCWPAPRVVPARAVLPRLDRSSCAAEARAISRSASETRNIRAEPRVIGLLWIVYNQSFGPLRKSRLGGRPTVGHVALDHVIGVRIPASQPSAFARSLRRRTTARCLAEARARLRDRRRTLTPYSNPDNISPAHSNADNVPSQKLPPFRRITEMSGIFSRLDCCSTTTDARSRKAVCICASQRSESEQTLRWHY